MKIQRDLKSCNVDLFNKCLTFRLNSTSRIFSIEQSELQVNKSHLCRGYINTVKLKSKLNTKLIRSYYKWLK